MQLSALIPLLPLLAGAHAWSIPTLLSAQLPLSDTSDLAGAAIQAAEDVFVPAVHAIDERILAALAAHDDPVDALLAVKPELAEAMEEKRYLRLMPADGDNEDARQALWEGMWMTEGDKLRLRRAGRGFMDLTEHMDSLNFPGLPKKNGSNVDAPHLPELTHGRYLKLVLPNVNERNIWNNLEHFSSFYSRYYNSQTGQQSAHWLHSQLSKIIEESPIQSRISLEYHPHWFAQPSIIARFETAIRNASQPLTIVGAHQDSANYLLPLLPAPGADDDGSGSMTILESFRVLAHAGYIPQRGPVEFQWFAAEEAGLLGSLDVAKYKRDLDVPISAMLEFDMTGWIKKDSPEVINFVTSQANPALTNWTAKVADTYCDIPTQLSSIDGTGAGSDYMSYTQYGYPSAFACESAFVDMEPKIHTVGDTLTQTDGGKMSASHMAQFAKLAIAFVVEQAGWSDRYTREGDNKHRMEL